MNWYKGDIAQAIAESRSKNAIFVVFVAGKDSNTERMTNMLNEQSIRSQLESENFVSIRIESDSVPYMQFASIYQAVPVPSIFFIGKSGEPIEIGTSILRSVDELDEKIKSALSSQRLSPSSSASSSFIAAEKKAVDERGQSAPVEKKPLEEKQRVTDKTESQSSESQESTVTSTKKAEERATVCESQEPTVTSNDKAEEQDIVCKDGICYRKPKEVSATGEPKPKQLNKESSNENREPPDFKKEVATTEKPKTNEKLNKGARNNNEEPKDLKKDVARTEEPKPNEQLNKDTSNENGESLRDLNARLEATRKLLEQKRRERIEDEKLLEKERELQRRRERREMQHLQEWQREQELKELKENIRRNRLEEQAAREHVRAKIAADRAERAQKFAVPKASVDAAVTKEQTEKSAAQNLTTKTDTVRLQFRLPNGDVHTHTFEPTVSIVFVRDYVSGTLLAGTDINEFVLATTYPRYEFTSEDNEKTLLDMGLFPSAVILVITQAGSKTTTIITRSGGLINIMHTLLWTMLAPVFSAFNYLRNIVAGRNTPRGSDGAQKRANEDSQANNEASKRRNLEHFMTGPSTSKEADKFRLNDDGNEQTHEQKPYRRYGASNVHRLSDNRKDSDDENATWNGNSTQQQ